MSSISTFFILYLSVHSADANCWTLEHEGYYCGNKITIYETYSLSECQDICSSESADYCSYNTVHKYCGYSTTCDVTMGSYYDIYHYDSDCQTSEYYSYYYTNTETSQTTQTISTNQTADSTTSTTTTQINYPSSNASIDNEWMTFSTLLEVTIFFAVYAIAIISYIAYKMCSSKLNGCTHSILLISLAFQLLLEVYDILTDAAQSSDFINGVSCGVSSCTQHYPEFGYAMIVFIALGSICTIFTHLYMYRKIKNIHNLQTDSRSTHVGVTQTSTSVNGNNSQIDVEKLSTQQNKILTAEIATQFLRLWLEDLPVLLIYFLYLSQSKIATFSGSDISGLMKQCYSDGYAELSGVSSYITWPVNLDYWDDFTWARYTYVEWHSNGQTLTGTPLSLLYFNRFYGMFERCVTDKMNANSTPITLTTTLLIGLAITVFDLFYTNISMAYMLCKKRTQFLKKILRIYSMLWTVTFICSNAMCIVIAMTLSEMANYTSSPFDSNAQGIGLLSANGECISTAYYITEYPPEYGLWGEEYYNIMAQKFKPGLAVEGQYQYEFTVYMNEKECKTSDLREKDYFNGNDCSITDTVYFITAPWYSSNVIRWKSEDDILVGLQSSKVLSLYIDLFEPGWYRNTSTVPQIESCVNYKFRPKVEDVTFAEHFYWEDQGVVFCFDFCN